MAIEMFAGKTGERLIPNLPVAETAYADVGVLTRAGLSATVQLVYRGGRAVKYPGLTPVFSTLDNISPVIRQQIELDLNVGGGVLSRADTSLDKILADRDSDDVFEELLSTLDPRAQGTVRVSLENFVASPPVCPRIMPGQPMQLILGQHISMQHAFELGTVETIAIHNPEAAMQLVHTA